MIAPASSPARTIFALSTAPGRAGIAVVRVSGPGAGIAIDALTSPRPLPRMAALRRLRDPLSGLLLDEALILYFQAPRSETGEDVAEFHLHGGKAVISAVLQVLARQPGCRPAEPGEFARRAFDNGKLDLAAIEGLADLIDAETESQRVQAVLQATGAQSNLYEGWRQSLLHAMALVEAAIDFSDEGDISIHAVSQAVATVRSLHATLGDHLDDGNRGEILREGYRVVLAGPPNVGKSSLLNALARRDAAIVSNEPGTTRDVIEVRLDLEGLPVIVSDTAGLRATASMIEQEGIRRTLAATRSADLVLWLEDSSAQPAAAPPADPALDGRKMARVTTKIDLSADRIHVKHRPSAGDEKSIHVKQAAPFAISTRTGEGLAELSAHLAACARAATGDPSTPAITRARHRHEITAALVHLENFRDHPAVALELRAEDLRLAATHLARLTGRIDAEHVLGEIFGRFCIGK